MLHKNPLGLNNIIEATQIVKTPSLKIPQFFMNNLKKTILWISLR